MQNAETKVIDLAVDANEQKGESLINYIPVEETPFTIVELKEEEKFFGVMGEYRLTEKFDSFMECKEDMTKLSWNNIIKVGTIIQQIVEKMPKDEK